MLNRKNQYNPEASISSSACPAGCQEEEAEAAQGSFTPCVFPPPARPALHPGFLPEFKAVCGITTSFTPVAAEAHFSEGNRSVSTLF